MTEKIRFPIHQRKVVDGEVWNIYRYHVLDRGNAVPCVRIITPLSAFCPVNFHPLLEGLQKIKPKDVLVECNSDIEIRVSSESDRDAVCELFEKCPTVPDNYQSRVGRLFYSVTRTLKELKISGFEIPQIMEFLISTRFSATDVQNGRDELGNNWIRISGTKDELDAFEKDVFPIEERRV